MEASRGPRLLPYRDRRPRLAADAFAAPGAVLIGDVELAAQASVWFGCVVRGDVCHVRLGARTNLQDGSILATLVGVEVTIGHGCIVHACTLEDRARELWLGRPARLVRKLSPEELEANAGRTRHYVELAAEYRAALGGGRGAP